MTDEKKPPRVTETWTYAGRRPPGKGTKPYHAWIDGNGESLLFDTGGSAIGGHYTVDVTRNPDSGNVTMYRNSVKYAGTKHDDEDQIAVWQAVDADTRRSLQRAAAERKQATNPELAAAVAELEALIAKCRTRAEAVALRSVVSERLDAAWWKR